jgi:predicted metalloprotease
MDWRGRRGSQNIEDRRSMSTSGRAGGIGGVGLIVVLLIGYFLGIDVTPLLEDPGAGPSVATKMTPADQAAGEFVSVTLADTEDVWGAVFPDQVGKPYTPAILVLFKGVTPSPCGGASGATGPFYCPLDRKVYLDTEFFATLEQRLGAGGDFAAAYVVAHEIGHHVQDELGILSQANKVRQKSTEEQSNQISVRIELQADCFAGIWARQASEQFGSLEQGDVEEAVNAARKIGDDTLQRSAGQRPMPHTFTHGTSDQRSRWFVKGYKTGDMTQCDTFGATRL